MKFGLFYEISIPRPWTPEKERTVYNNCLEQVKLADELGFDVARDRVHVHDLQATILHLLGLEHTRLTYRFQGRDFRLTDVSGEVVRGILA